MVHIKQKVHIVWLTFFFFFVPLQSFQEKRRKHDDNNQLGSVLVAHAHGPRFQQSGPEEDAYSNNAP